MARNFNGSSDAITTTGALDAIFSLTQMSYGFWGYRANTSGGVVMAPAAGSGSGYRVEMSHWVDGNLYTAAEASAGSYVYAALSTSVVGWNHYLTVYDGTMAGDVAKFTVYVNGVAIGLTWGSGTTSGSIPGSPSSFCAFQYDNVSGGRYLGPGGLAECAIWAGWLTADDAAALGRGFSPLLVRRSALAYYWPMIGRGNPEPELIRGAVGNLANTTTFEHPRILSPRRRPMRVRSAALPPSPVIYQLEPKRLRVFLTR